MQTSEAINELAGALAKAQAENDVETEGRVINRLVRAIRGKRFKGNSKDGKTPTQRLFEKVAFGMSDCWYWVGAIDARIGYGTFNLLGENKAHRVSWIIHNGPIPSGLKVLHKCDVRNCVNPDHLFLGTQTDNMRDMAEKGRRVQGDLSGERNGCAKLTWADVREIRRIYAAGCRSMKSIGQEYGVGAMNICRIVNNEMWRE